MIWQKNIAASLAVFLISLLLSACGFFQAEEEEGALARVGDSFLHLEDIEGLANAKSEDSSNIVANYVDSWVKEHLLLQKALQNLPDKEVNFEKQLENYRRSLIIYAYENQLLRQKLDTLITDDQLEVYYRNHKDNFELREDIVQIRMLLLRSSAPHQDSLQDWLFSRDSASVYRLVDYCTSYAEKCALDTAEWISVNTLRSYLPDNGIGLTSLKVGENILSDSVKTIMIDLYDRKRKGERAPVSYVADQIRAIIKNQRRLKLLADVRKQIFEDASLKNSYEIYN